ncbi:ATP-binding protein [Patescibacteria group bacterium]|nr:ATP-binding protein [Patescibacteria group bacterium]
MDLHFYISTLVIVLMGTATIFFSIREENGRQILIEREKKMKQKLYEITILKEIQEKIGYWLDIEKVAEVIIGSLKNLLPYSSASFLLLKGDKLIFRTDLEEPVSREYINEVKKNMLNSLSTLSKNSSLPSHVEENLTGAVIDDSNRTLPSSFFHIPVMIKNEVVGIINVSSVKTDFYKEEEKTILYQITNQATDALSKLQSVLATEKGKLMAMIGSLADGVFMIDRNNELLVINNTAKNFLNINKENATIFDVISAFSHNYDLLYKVQESISQNKTIEEKEVGIGSKTIQIFITPVVDSSTNKVIGASVLLHDITIEKELSKIKDDFTNMMVHELRAPLTAIKQASTLIIQDKTMQDEEKDKFLHLINDQSKLLLTDVSSLLDASKIESGKFSVQKAPSDMKKIIEDSVNVFIPQAREKNIELMTHFDQDLPKIFCDAVRIGEVINNLVSNSFKFTEEGGKIKIEVLKGNDPKLITVSVSDNGIGIPKDKQDKLFMRFSQIDSQVTHQKAISGSGLGLFITKGIVEAHGGKIRLESEVGQGTTVTVTLPVGESEEIYTSTPEAEHAPVPSSPIFGTIN